MKRARAVTQGSIFTLLGLLVAALIVLLLVYRVFHAYFGNKSGLDTHAQQSLAGEGIDFSSPRGLLETTKSKVDALNAQVKERDAKMDSLKESP